MSAWRLSSGKRGLRTTVTLPMKRKGPLSSRRSWVLTKRLRMVGGPTGVGKPCKQTTCKATGIHLTVVYVQSSHLHNKRLGQYFLEITKRLASSKASIAANF